MSLLGTLWMPPKGNPKLERHILSNGPYQVIPQWAVEVTATHNFVAISNHFASGLLEDPVVSVLSKLDLRDLSFKKSLLCLYWGKETSHVGALYCL